MKVTIDPVVHKTFPDLAVFFSVIQEKDITSSFVCDPDIRLSEEEIAAYRSFRTAIAGDTLLAVERLKSFDNPENLPSPDPLTGFIIKASYRSSIPITVFSNDTFDTVQLRLSIDGDALVRKGVREQLPSGSLIADTEQGILGRLGIRSASVGELTIGKTESVVVLSFGCSKSTNKKSKDLVDYAVSKLTDRKGSITQRAV